MSIPKYVIIGDNIINLDRVDFIKLGNNSVQLQYGPTTFNIQCKDTEDRDATYKKLYKTIKPYHL